MMMMMMRQVCEKIIKVVQGNQIEVPGGLKEAEEDEEEVQAALETVLQIYDESR